MKRFAFFPGCLIPYRLPSIEVAARRVFEILGLELVELSGYSCCPDPITMRLVDNKLWLLMACRNLSLAEELGLDIAVLCNGCYETLYEAARIIRNDPEKLNEINQTLSKIGKTLKGEAKVKHFVEILYEDTKIMHTKLSRYNNLGLAMHYGCHLSTGNGNKPGMMEELAKITGARVISYNLEKLCCGFPTMQVDEEFGVKERLLPKLKRIKKSHADCILTSCSACTIQFETGQIKLHRYGESYNIPCVHLLELLALCLDVPPEKLGLEFHRSDVQRLVMEKMS